MAHIGNLAFTEREMVIKSRKILESGDPSIEPIVTLRHKILVQGFSGFLTFGRIFADFDKEGLKILYLDQFLKAMKETGLDVSESDCEKIFHSLEVDGEMNILSFLAAVKVSLNQNFKRFYIY